MKKSIYIITVLASLFFLGWGAVGHRMINRKFGLSFPAAMSPLSWFIDSMAFHASDADYRKNTDPTEEYRHYIDIEYYSEFLSTGRIPQNWDSLVALHGLNFVIGNGYVPFAIIATTDSVKKYFELHNWQMAMLKAADLGHYVADAHNPLHCTRYYNGWSTFSNGIHSRYETSLITRDTAFIQYSGNTVTLINDINNFAFNIVYSTHPYVDSVYYADSVAHTIAGNTSSTQYYQEFWNRAGNYTINLFKNASYKLACLVYTAWVNAGSPLPVGISQQENIVEDYKLYQNYPNPFNPKTKIKYQLTKNSFVLLEVFDINGREIKTLVDKKQNSGEFEYVFDAANLSSGIYFYRLSIDNSIVDVKKMILIK
jgi:hypothetical protein